MKESDYICGRRAVLEALRGSPGRMNKLFIAEGSHGRTTDEICNLARQNKVIIKTLPKRSIDKMASVASHQGVIASVAPVEYAEADALIEPFPNGKPALVLVLDELTDMQNFGAILRTADAAGVNGVIIPRHRSVGLTPVVAKISAGASEYVPVAKVANIARIIEALEESGIQTVGASDDAERTIYDIDFTVPTGIVIGGEEKGIRPLVRKKCDLMARIPMRGSIASLNASVAAAIIVYEALRQRESG